MRSCLASVLTLVLLVCAIPAAAQTTSSPDPKFGIAVSASTLGVSFEAGARVHSKVILRVGTNFLNYSRDFEDDEDITYTGTLRMRSVHAYVDWFPTGGGFHISPGMVLHNGNTVGLSATILPGNEVDLGDETYVSSSSNPITAAGEVTVKSARPALSIGWGSLIPRSRRISVPFRIGVVFQGSPAATLNFTGTACDRNGLNCRDMASDPTIQSNITAEEASLNDDIKKFKFYPVLSFGIGIRF